jgi:hypothetical protein
MTTPKRAQIKIIRRVGATGQFGFQSRSHDAPDCGSYRLIRCVGAGAWEVERTAPCDQHPGDPATMTVQFVSSAKYHRAF